ncbi:C-type lectin domain family 2 member A [Pteronotus mesoamericanus]|uniref:C-type lectin domain family 2 member A n=1 Tax=Pteronotus mesoamericanus TaxID=1884717 RepID=UPI0023ECC244|nr:C-type lectin domain family 2 member A [Pteronotus parnellii mesoamericanus]
MRLTLTPLQLSHRFNVGASAAHSHWRGRLGFTRHVENWKGRHSFHNNYVKLVHKSKSNWVTLTLITFTVISVVFIIIVCIILSSRNSQAIKNPQTIKCPGKWIEVRYKCFYFSDDTRNWTGSKTFCSSQRSELAWIDTHKDLEFLKNHTGTLMHWIGLSRKQGEPWRWTNGQTFNAWFEISGNGSFAFLNADGVYSSRGLDDMKWICSKPKF